MKILFASLAVLFSGALFSQPWLYETYRTSGKQIEDISNQDQIRAFDDYWQGKTPAKGKGFMAFSRWKEFTEVRTQGYSRIPSDIYFSEWLKDQQVRSVSGNWTYIGAHDTPLQINTGERSGSGRVNAMAFHPTDPNIIYIGAPAGGFWKSTNGGVTWQTTTDQLASIGVSDIALHPDDPNTIFICTGDADASDTYSFGLMKSTDAGQTWSTTGYNPLITSNQLASRVLINPESPDTILLATNTSLRLSSNGGDSFSITKTGNYRDMKFKPGDPSVVYASSYLYYGGASVYKSTNGGKNWTEISPPSEEMDSVSRIAIGVSEHNPSVVYLLTVNAENNSFYALYRSADEGVTWERKYHYSQKNLLGYEANGSDDGGQGWYDLALDVSPLNSDVVIVGGVNLWRSNTGGATFNLIGHWWGDWADYVHADQHMVKYQPGTGCFFAGNDGGFYKTCNDGNSWTDLSDGLHIMQIYRMGVASHGSDMIICGTQDNGTMLKMDWLWNYVLGGDGMDCMIDQTEPGTMYGEYYYGQLFRTYNGGYSWDDIKPSQAQPGSWITPLAMHPTNSNTLYAGYEEVYRTTNQGNSWSRISVNLLDSQLIRILVLAPSNPSVIVAGNQDKLKRTTDNGMSWTSIYDPLFNGQLTSVCISPTNPLKMWATVSGYVASRKVFYSADGGATWQGMATGLPNVPVNCLVYEPGSPDRVYAGTDLGVYVTDTLLTSWIPFKSGLPNTVVNELEISHNELIAATYGRGLWKSDLLTEYPQGVASVSQKLICRIYPNPAVSYIDVNVPQLNGKRCVVSLIAIDGTVVFQKSYTGTSFRVDVSGLAQGLYILSVESAEGKYMNRIQISGE